MQESNLPIDGKLLHIPSTSLLRIKKCGVGLLKLLIMHHTQLPYQSHDQTELIRRIEVANDILNPL